MKILILFIINCSSLFAESVWSYGSRKLEVEFLQNEKVFISKECLKVKKTCLAFRAISHPLPGIFSSFGGINPGSRVCSEKLLGKIFIATDEEGGTQAFCLFSDQSYVSLGGLWK